jgi:ABC-type multidrug transport system fused ATPase/permease subunit
VSGHSGREVFAWLASCVDGSARRYGLQAVFAMLSASLCTMGGAAALAMAVSSAIGGHGAAIAWLVVAITAAGAGRLLDVVKARAYALAEFSLERVLTRRVFRAAIGASRHNPVGGQLQEVMTIVVGGRLVFQHALFTAPSALIDASLAAVFLVSFGQVKLGAFLLLFALGYVWLAFRLALPISASARDLAGARATSSACFGDVLLNRDAVRWYGALEFVTGSFDRTFGRVGRDTGRLTDTRARAAIATASAFAFGYGVCLALAWYGADTSATRIRDIVLANTCVLALMRPLEQAAQAMRDLVLARAWIAPLATLSEPPAALHHARDPSETGVAISARGLSFGYARDKVLEAASFEIAAGAVVGLRGASGAGKSTLLRLLIGDARPAEGHVAWDGALTPPSFAVAPQETFLLDDSVAANIAFGRHVSADDVCRAAALVGLDRLLAQSGRDLDFEVGERGRGLSGGERQRVQLARAIAVKQSLYVLDEATSALDPKTERDVLDAIIAAVRGSTVIIVSHRGSAFSLCDSMLELSGGKVTACDPALLASVHTGPSEGMSGPHNLAAKT